LGLRFDFFILFNEVNVDNTIFFYYTADATDGLRFRLFLKNKKKKVISSLSLLSLYKSGKLRSLGCLKRTLTNWICECCRFYQLFLPFR